MSSVQTLVLVSSPEFVVQVRLHAKMFGVTAAEFVRGAASQRLKLRHPENLEWRDGGPRTAKLKFDVDSTFKREIEVAAEREGLSISRWVERAVCEYALDACQHEAAKMQMELLQMTAHVRGLQTQMLDAKVTA